jgi:hypothetical protein
MSRIARLFGAGALALVLAGCYPELDWRELAWEEGHLKVLLPSKPSRSSREVLLAGQKVSMEMLQSQRPGMAFGVAWSPLPDGERKAVLDAARDALLRNIDGRLVAEREVTVRGTDSPGREFIGEGVVAGTPMLLAARVIAVPGVAGGRFYQVVFVGRKDRAENVDLPLYLGSLTLVP